MNFAKNLRYLRHKSGHSQEKLAEELHYKSFTTIQKWEDGTSTPPYKVIEKIAEMYHVTVDAIMHGNMEESQSVNVPILGIVRGGEPIYAEQNTLGYEPVSPQETVGGEYFYLEVVGDSMMNDRILPGDILYVRKQNTLNNGDIGIVLLDGQEATVKRVYFKEDRMILQPSNPKYSPIEVLNSDYETRQVQILGKVIHNKIRY